MVKLSLENIESGRDYRIMSDLSIPAVVSVNGPIKPTMVKEIVYSPAFVSSQFHNRSKDRSLSEEVFKEVAFELANRIIHTMTFQVSYTNPNKIIFTASYMDEREKLDLINKHKKEWDHLNRQFVEMTEKMHHFKAKSKNFETQLLEERGKTWWYITKERFWKLFK